MPNFDAVAMQLKSSFGLILLVLPQLVHSTAVYYTYNTADYVGAVSSTQVAGLLALYSATQVSGNLAQQAKLGLLLLFTSDEQSKQQSCQQHTCNCGFTCTICMSRGLLGHVMTTGALQLLTIAAGLAYYAVLQPLAQLAPFQQ